MHHSFHSMFNADNAIMATWIGALTRIVKSVGPACAVGEENHTDGSEGERRSMERRRGSQSSAFRAARRQHGRFIPVRA